MPHGTTKHPIVGKRVQIPAYTDTWMRGARFGTIERVRIASGKYLAGNPAGLDQVAVRMDHPQVKRPVWCILDDCTYC